MTGKNAALTLAALAVALMASTGAHAGALVGLGYASTDTMISMQPGGFLGGFDILPNGDYVINDGNAIRVISPNGVERAPLYTYASSVYGSFVRYWNGSVYFGESSTGSIMSVPASGGAAVSVADLDFNYDMDVSNGSAYVVAGNAIYQLGESGADEIVSVTGNSGPLAFDSAGNLHYAPSHYPDGTSILQWSASEVAGAVGPGSLGEADADALASISGAYGLTVDGSDRLMFTNNALANPGVQMRAGSSAWTMAEFNTSLGLFPFLTFMRYNASNGSISVALSWYDEEFAGYTAISTLTPVPEPSSLMALTSLIGLAGCVKLLRRGK